MAVDATVAGVSADSYVSLADADAYVVEVGDSSTWNAASDTEKENFLKRAARVIGRYNWDYGRYDVSTVTAGQPNGQALAFPTVIDVDGAGDPFIPAAVEECACAVALAIAEGGSDTGSSSTAAVKSLKAGSFDVEFDTDEGAVTASTLGETVREILGHRMAHAARTV